MKKENSKFMKQRFDWYLKSDMNNIFQAYDKPSEKKIDAWEYCEKLCKKYYGKDLKVVTKNKYTFTAGFVSDLEGTKYFFYITPLYDRYIPITWRSDQF